MTYAEIQAQIVQRLDQRTDLQQVIYDFSQDRIAYWADFFFYSSDVIDTSITTAAGQVFYNLPSNIWSLNAIRLLIPGSSGSTTTTSQQYTLPTATINVGSTSGFSLAGTISVGGQTISYTGVTLTSFTGCSGGFGVVGSGAIVTQVAPATTLTGDTTLPLAIITVGSTAGFRSSGAVTIGGSTVSYTSLTSTTFNGCVGGLGTFVAGTAVSQLYGTWLSLSKMNYYRMIEVDVTAPNNQAQPSWWSQFNTQFRLYPVPDAAYALECTGNAAPAAPVNDQDTNFWTTDAATLIINATCAEVRNLYLHDQEGAAPYAAATDRERHKLMKLTVNTGNPLIIRDHL